MSTFPLRGTLSAPVFRSLIALSLATLACGAQAQNRVGLGLGVIPKYEGSKDYRVLPVPILSYESGSFFVSPRAGLPSLGLKTELSNDWSAGVFLGMGLGRKSRRSSQLDGMDDIDFHGVAGVYTEWRPGRFAIGAAYYQALHSGYGGVAELRGSYLALQRANDSVRIGVSTQWASGDSMRTHFGVRQHEAAASNGRLYAYSPSSGFKSVSMFGTWRHQLNNRWSLATTVGVNTLVGDAADSPIVEDKVSVFGTIGVTYSF